MIGLTCLHSINYCRHHSSGSYLSKLHQMIKMVLQCQCVLTID